MELVCGGSGAIFSNSPVLGAFTQNVREISFIRSSQPKMVQAHIVYFPARCPNYLAADYSFLCEGGTPSVEAIPVFRKEFRSQLARRRR